MTEAKNDIYSIIRQAEKEEVLITRHGKPAAVITGLNDSLKKPTPRSKLRGIYGFLPFGTGRRPTRCFLGTLQRAAGNDQVQRRR